MRQGSSSAKDSSPVVDPSAVLPYARDGEAAGRLAARREAWFVIWNPSGTSSLSADETRAPASGSGTLMSLLLPGVSTFSLQFRWLLEPMVRMQPRKAETC